METCDKCGPTVKAAFQVKTLSGDLFFCGHHLHEYSPTILQQSYEVVELNKEKVGLTATV